MNTNLQTILDTQLKDIYGIWHIPFWQRTTFRVSVGVLLFMGVAVCALLLFRAWQRRRPKVIVPAWKEALSQLDALSTDQFSGPEQVMDFYTRITRVLRIYLQARYQCDLVGKTDDELLVCMGAELSKTKVAPLLHTVVTESVEARFFPVSVGAAQMRQHLVHARRIVTMTVERDMTTQQ